MDRLLLLSLVALVIGGMLRAVNSGAFQAAFAGTFKRDFPKRAIPWMALGLGVISSLVSAMSAGATFTPATAARFILEGLFAGAGAIGGHETAGKALRGAPPSAGAVLVLAALALPATACAAQMRPAVEAIGALDPHLRLEYQRQIEACANLACVEETEKRWEPVIQGLQIVRRVWCDMDPKAEGCSGE